MLHEPETFHPRPPVRLGVGERSHEQWHPGDRVRCLDARSSSVLTKDDLYTVVSHDLIAGLVRLDGYTEGSVNRLFIEERFVREGTV